MNVVLSKEELMREFERVRRRFFPRWDRKREWTFSFLDKPVLGLCKIREKAIGVSRGAHLDGIEALQELIIHEIAHAVTGVGHGTRWRVRMLRAVDLAKRLEMHALAAKLIQDTYSYEAQGVAADAPAAGWYEQIRIRVFDDPARSLDDIMREMTSLLRIRPEEFMSRFRMTRRTYNQAQKFRRRYQTTDEAWLAWEEKH